MGQHKELFIECEEQFGKIVRASRDKDPMALWFLFEYIEWRLTKEKINASTDTKSSSDKETDTSGSNDEAEQFTFGGVYSKPS
jgi:hypothetical protein